MERIIVDISSGYDIYDNTEVKRKVVMRQVVINDEANTVNINLLVKHHLLINGQLIHVKNRYDDLVPTITATEEQSIYLESDGDIHIFKQIDLNLWEGAELNVNTFPILDFITSIRNQPIIFDDFIRKIIETSAQDGDFDIHPALKYSL